MTDTDSIALQTIIDEFRNISPEITDAFMFKADGEIEACIESKAMDRVKKSIFSFNDVNEKAAIIGGIASLSIQGADSQLNVVSINNRHLATISSRAANPKIVKALTTVIVPTVVRLMDQLASEVSEPEIDQLNLKKEYDTICPSTIPDQNKPIWLNPEPALPEPPINQLMVEKIEGLFCPSDIVRVDCEVVEKWVNLYGDKRIAQVQIQTLEGKAVICRFKPMKESSPNLNGIVQIPNQILQALQTSKGKLVMIKPVIK